MPRIERTAEVVWEGNLARGGGHVERGQRRLLGPAVLAAVADRPAGGEDEPQGAARRRRMVSA